MNKQEAIEKLEKIRAVDILDDVCNHGALDYKRGVEETKDLAINIINQLDEPEKPVVPQFVADYIDKSKEYGRTLFTALDYSNTTTEMDCWLPESDNVEIFVQAWIFGYEAKKEKLYTVELPNPNEYEFKAILSKKYDGSIVIEETFNVNWRKYNHFRLTEAEIKKDFDWAWQFAKEVEE